MSMRKKVNFVLSYFYFLCLRIMYCLIFLLVICIVFVYSNYYELKTGNIFFYFFGECIDGIFGTANIKLKVYLSLMSPFCFLFFDSEKVEFSHYIIAFFVCLLINCLVLEDCFCFLVIFVDIIRFYLSVCLFELYIK